MNYSELIFRQRSPEKLYPDKARQLVAAACDGLDIDPAIFNRSSNGKTLSGTYGATTSDNPDNPPEGYGIPPRIIFDAGLGFIRLYGVGTEGSRILESEAPKLFSALFKLGFIGLDHKEGEMKLEAQVDDSLYAVRTLVLARNPGVCKQFVKTELDGDVARAAGEIFLRGLHGMARLLDNERIAEGLKPTFEGALPRDVTFLEGTSIPVMIKPGIRAAAYKDILLSMPCKLRGPWASGLLRARGYGLVRPFNPTRGEQ